MKKIDLNFAINDLDGQEIGRANKLAAMAFISKRDGDPVKLFDWAMTINKQGTLEVDDSDFSTIKETIKNSEPLTVLVKGQILKYLSTIA